MIIEFRQPLPTLKNILEQDGNVQTFFIITGPLIEFVALVEKAITVESLNAAMKAASNKSFGYTDEH